MNMKIKSEWVEVTRTNKNEKTETIKVLSFGNFYVVKLSEKYFAVKSCDFRLISYFSGYNIDSDREISSGTTLDSASKKAKLLQIGYSKGFEDVVMSVVI